MVHPLCALDAVRWTLCAGRLSRSGMLRSLLLLAVMISALSAAEPLKLTLRSQPKQPDGTFAPLEKPLQWDAKKTVLIVCDMWNDHWCKSAARRMTEMAGPMNDMLKIARAKGVRSRSGSRRISAGTSCSCAT